MRHVRRCIIRDFPRMLVQNRVHREVGLIRDSVNGIFHDIDVFVDYGD